MTSQVLLREVVNEEKSKQETGPPENSNGERNRMHLVRLGDSLFGDLLRLLREALAGGKGSGGPPPDQLPLDGRTPFRGKSAVLFLPMI